jgi:formate dehydrogenase subunit gamma
MLSGQHVASHKFNAGEKIVFWGGVIALGLVVVASGFVLDKLVPGMPTRAARCRSVTWCMLQRR